jgi:hypothetical protein
MGWGASSRRQYSSWGPVHFVLLLVTSIEMATLISWLHLSNSVSVLIENGLGSFQPQALFVVGSGAVGVAVGDFNEDSYIDDSYIDVGANSVSVFFGKPCDS